MTTSAPAPDFEALAEVLLMAHDEPEGLTPSALRKLRDARRAAIDLLISSPSAYRDLHPDVLKRDVSRLRTELVKTTVEIAEPSLARQKAKAEVGSAFPALTMLDLGAISHAADVLRELVDEADEADDERAHDEPLIDPDCRDGKCASCVGGPCKHGCHVEEDVEQDVELPGTDVTRVDESEPKPGEVFTDLHGNVLFAVGGGRMNLAVELFAKDGMPVNPTTRLKRMRIVPADAIVLEQPTDEDVAELKGAMAELPVVAQVADRGLMKLVQSCRTCNALVHTLLLPSHGRTHAALVALAADEAERGQQ